MEEHITSEADRWIPISLDTGVDSILKTIDAKWKQLRANGLTLSDQEILKKDRLRFVWAESTGTSERKGATAWRKTRARRAYSAIQDTNEHLFLAMILAITPTECAKTSFDNVIEHLIRLQDFEPYCLSLAAKSFFESTAAEQGYSGSRGYLSFMKALFPPNEEPRQIQFAYSNIPLENIERLFQIMRKGSEASQQWHEERGRQEKTSSFVTALVPTGEKDCCFTVVVGRDDMMRGLRQLGLTQFKLS